MARTKKNALLDAVKSTFGSSQSTEEVTDMDHQNVFDEPNTDNLDNVDTPASTEDPKDNKKDPKAEDVNNNSPEDNKDPNEDNSTIPQDVLDRMNNSSVDTNKPDEGDDTDPNNNDSNNDQTNPEEAAGVGAFFDAFAEALHWDVADEDKPKSIDGLIDYIGDVVEQNSKPEYADQRIAQLDQYVKNGGKFEDFYSNMSQAVSYDDMDMEDESNQKTVVRDYMKLQGFTDEQINNKIERYDDAGLLEDEATDAVARLKDIKQQQLEAAQQQQAAYAEQQEQYAQQFSHDLVTNITNLKTIRGIAVPQEDRRALWDYITRTDADGLTQYQKDFNKNQVKNLIESAYFTMKGDALIGEAEKQGQTTANQRLRTMLRHQAKNHSTYNVQEKQESALDIASKLFR